MIGKPFLKFAAASLLLSYLDYCAMFRGTQWYANHPLQEIQKLTDPATGKVVVFIPMHSCGVLYFFRKDHGFRLERRYKAQNDY